VLFTTLAATAQVGDIDAPMSCRIVIKGDDSTAACAAEPVVFAKFDTDPGFDLSSLTAGNFYDVIIRWPSRKDGSVASLSFTGRIPGGATRLRR